ncbi:hypothetical protein [Myceligenerans indicum]|uniref:Integral membrane protein n=1 Tax=Myceligenerans indicum TaxID=2593663 RepID=A0ABS1LPX8_9MICO|nr:hypothetical protein [Myceligenerans indicum]MBL0888088.1 hypothetical protein [Myceligenerans indicum]
MPLLVSLACFGGGGAVAVLVYPALALVLHVVLVVVAIATDAPMGGPLALPFLLVVATLAGIGYTLLAYAVLGVSTLVGSRSERRVLIFAVVSIVLLVGAVGAGVMVLAVREPAMPTTEALAWSAGITAGGVPAWLVVAAVWALLTGLRGRGASTRRARAIRPGLRPIL